MLLSFFDDDFQLEDEPNRDLSLINERSDLTQNTNCCDYPVFCATEEFIRYSLNQLCNQNFQPINYEYEYTKGHRTDYDGESYDEELYVDTGDMQINQFQLKYLNFEGDSNNSKAISEDDQFDPMKNGFKSNCLGPPINVQQSENNVNYVKNLNGKREYKQVSIGKNPTLFEVGMISKGYSKCEVKNDDMYSPHWIIYHSGDKEGLCQICFEKGVEETFKLKSSSYWYHMNYYHGVSSKTKGFYPNPIEYRSYNRPKTKSQKLMKDFTPRALSQGLCKNCNKWIELDSKKMCPIKSPNIYWWKHCQKCLFPKKNKY